MVENAAHGAVPRDNDPSSEITLELPATEQWLNLARTVAFDIGMRADFGVDSLEDLKIAVDEACSQLIGFAAPGAVVSCRFHLSGHGLHAIFSTDAASPVTVSRESFGWHVLTVVADEVAVEDGVHTEGGRYPVTFRIVKQRAVTPTQGAS